MTDKILMGEVFFETIALVKKRIRYIAVMIIFMLVIMTPFDWSVRQSEEIWTSPLLWVVLLLTLILGTIVQVCAFNNFIETLRGASVPLIPQGLIGKGLKMLFAELLLFLAVLIPGVLVMAAITLATAMLLPEAVTGFGYDILLGVVSSIGVLLGFGVLGVRWGAGIAATAVGERISFKDSWRMTRGYTVPLLVFAIPMVFVPALIQVLIKPDVTDAAQSLFTPELLSLSLLSGITYWFSYVAFSVWYVKLTERYNAILEVRVVAE